MSARVRYRCTLIGPPGPFAEEGVLGWEVREVTEWGTGPLLGMYFAHRDRLDLTSSQPAPMPDIERVLDLTYAR